jgi:hypothetical protein
MKRWVTERRDDTLAQRRADELGQRQRGCRERRRVRADQGFGFGG